MSSIKHRSPVVRSFRLVLRMPCEADERITAADLPEPCAALLRTVVKRTRLWPREKADVARELIDHVHDALAAERSPEQIVADFGNPTAAAKLIRRARRRQRHPLLRAWTAAVKITVVSPVVLLGLYGLLWICFHIGDPTITTNYAAMIEERWPDAGPGRPPYEVYELSRIKWNDVSLPLDELAREKLQDQRWSPSPAADVPHLDPSHPMFDDVARAFREFAPHLDAVASAAERPGHGTPIASDLRSPETYLDATVDPEDRLTEIVPFPENIANQPPLWSVLLPHLGWMRTNARLLAFDGRLALAEGDADRFVARTKSQLDLARQASKDGIIICDLVAVAIHSLACAEVSRAIRDRPEVLSPEHLSSLANTITASHHRVLTVRFEIERFITRDVLQRSFTDNGRGNGRLTNESYDIIIADLGFNDFGYVPDTYQPGTGTKLLAPLVATIVADRQAQLDVIDDQISQAEAALARGPSAMPDVIAANQRLAQRFGSNFARTRYFVAAIHSPSTDRILETVFKSRAMSDATRAALAAETHRRQHGNFPESLDNLVPAYLLAVPEDPFAPGTPLRMLTLGETLIIYSVGQDADDDQGAPLLDGTGGRANHSFSVRYAATGSERQRRRPFFVPITPSSDPGDGDWVLYPPAD
ncbi:MAG: hypothetical protein AAFR76_00265 [Planctomycetota bacterium]